MKAALLCIVLLLAGCVTGSTPAPRVIVAPTGPATAAEIAGLKEQIAQLRKSFETQRDLAQLAAGAVYGASEANASNPAGLPREATAAQLEEAARALPSATDAQKLEKANQNARILAGELVAVKAEMGQRASEIDALKVARDAAVQRATGAEATALAAKLELAGAEERAKAAEKLQQQFDGQAAVIAAKDQEISDLKGKWTRNTQLWAARGLVASGILIVIAGAAIVWISGLAALGKAGGIALSGILLIGAGLIVGHKYFLPVAGSALAVLLAAGAWYLWHVRRTQQLAKGMMLSVQDMKDAAAAGSEKAKVAVEELKENLLYRFPRTPEGDASALEKEIDRRLVVEGINSPKP